MSPADMVLTTGEGVQRCEGAELCAFRFLKTVEVFDPATGAWSTAAPMLSARRYHSSVVLDGKLCVTGGLDYDFE